MLCSQNVVLIAAGVGSHRGGDKQHQSKAAYSTGKAAVAARPPPPLDCPNKAAEVHSLTSTVAKCCNAEPALQLQMEDKLS